MTGLNDTTQNKFYKLKIYFMKRLIILNFILLFTAIVNYSFGKTSTTPTPDSSKITTLIIDANVKVVLADNENAQVQVFGDNTFTKLVTIKRSGDTLVIGSSKYRDLKSSGTIYVPANQLQNIRVNNSAQVQSLTTLQIPKLDVVVNGACKVTIASMGEVNLIETDGYLVDKTVVVRQVPQGIFLKP